VDGVIRTLEEPLFAVLDQLHAPVRIFGVEVLQTLAGQYGGRGNVILRLNLIRWIKVWP
jgi:hypothetical protein